MATAKIAKLRKDSKLVRNLSLRWVPRRTDEFKLDKDKLGNSFGRTTRSRNHSYWTAHRRIYLTPTIAQWLTEDGQKWLKSAPTSGRGKSPATAADPRTKLTSPFVITLSFPETAMGDPRENENADPGAGSATGLVIRDPAPALLRICQAADPVCDSNPFFPAEDYPVETTTEMSRTNVSVTQFGRLLILPQTSSAFQTATIGTGLDPDGTIAKMSFKTTSTLASAIGSIGGAANTLAAGVAARNAAIAQANTAEGAVVDLRSKEFAVPGAYNKALADCLANHATIIKAGGQPAPCQ